MGAATIPASKLSGRRPWPVAMPSHAPVQTNSAQGTFSAQVCEERSRAVDITCYRRRHHEQRFQDDDEEERQAHNPQCGGLDALDFVGAIRTTGGVASPGYGR